MDLRYSSITADILNVLLDGKIHTSSEIAERVEVSKKTVLRHIQSLSYRYPIETFNGGDIRGGIMLNKKYINNGEILTNDDLNLLNEALTFLSEKTESNEKRTNIQNLLKRFSLQNKN